MKTRYCFDSLGSYHKFLCAKKATNLAAIKKRNILEAEMDDADEESTVIKDEGSDKSQRRARRRRSSL